MAFSRNAILVLMIAAFGAGFGAVVAMVVCAPRVI